MMDDILEKALTNLKPNARWSIKGETVYANLTWLDESQTKPTEAEIDDEVIRLEKEYSDSEYARNRKMQFPELGEQLDLLFHDMTAGKGSKDGEWYKVVAKVKEDNPKPE